MHLSWVLVLLGCSATTQIPECRKKLQLSRISDWDFTRLQRAGTDQALVNTSDGSFNLATPTATIFELDPSSIVMKGRFMESSTGITDDMLQSGFVIEQWMTVPILNSNLLDKLPKRSEFDLASGIATKSDSTAVNTCDGQNKITQFGYLCNASATPARRFASAILYQFRQYEKQGDHDYIDYSSIMDLRNNPSEGLCHAKVKPFGLSGMCTLSDKISDKISDQNFDWNPAQFTPTAPQLFVQIWQSGNMTRYICRVYNATEERCKKVIFYNDNGVYNSSAPLGSQTTAVPVNASSIKDLFFVFGATQTYNPGKIPVHQIAISKLVSPTGNFDNLVDETYKCGVDRRGPFVPSFSRSVKENGETVIRLCPNSAEYKDASFCYDKGYTPTNFGFSDQSVNISITKLPGQGALFDGTTEIKATPYLLKREKSLISLRFKPAPNSHSWRLKNKPQGSGFQPPDTKSVLEYSRFEYEVTGSTGMPSRNNVSMYVFPEHQPPVAIADANTEIVLNKKHRFQLKGITKAFKTISNGDVFGACEVKNATIDTVPTGGKLFTCKIIDNGPIWCDSQDLIEVSKGDKLTVWPKGLDQSLEYPIYLYYVYNDTSTGGAQGPQGFNFTFHVEDDCNGVFNQSSFRNSTYPSAGIDLSKEPEIVPINFENSKKSSPVVQKIVFAAALSAYAKGREPAKVFQKYERQRIYLVCNDTVLDEPSQKESDKLCYSYNWIITSIPKKGKLCEKEYGGICLDSSISLPHTINGTEGFIFYNPEPTGNEFSKNYSNFSFYIERPDKSKRSTESVVIIDVEDANDAPVFVNQPGKNSTAAEFRYGKTSETAFPEFFQETKQCADAYNETMKILNFTFTDVDQDDPNAIYTMNIATTKAENVAQNAYLYFYVNVSLPHSGKLEEKKTDDLNFQGTRSQVNQLASKVGVCCTKTGTAKIQVTLADKKCAECTAVESTMNIYVSCAKPPEEEEAVTYGTYIFYGASGFVGLLICGLTISCVLKRVNARKNQKINEARIAKNFELNDF